MILCIIKRKDVDVRINSHIYVLLNLKILFSVLFYNLFNIFCTVYDDICVVEFLFLATPVSTPIPKPKLALIAVFISLAVSPTIATCPGSTSKALNSGSKTLGCGFSSACVSVEITKSKRFLVCVSSRN